MKVINIYRIEREKIIRRRMILFIVLLLSVVSCFSFTIENRPKEIKLKEFVSAEDMLMEVQNVYKETE